MEFYAPIYVRKHKSKLGARYASPGNSTGDARKTPLHMTSVTAKEGALAMDVIGSHNAILNAHRREVDLL